MTHAALMMSVSLSFFFYTTLQSQNVIIKVQDEKQMTLTVLTSV